MTKTKLATVALAIAAFVAGALLPAIQGYLFPVATLLLGLAGPEVGKK